MTTPLPAAVEHIPQTVGVRARTRSAAPAPVPAATTEPPSDAVTHVHCCDPDRSLCGLDLTGVGPAKPGEQECVVCVDLDETDADCPLCPAA